MRYLIRECEDADRCAREVLPFLLEHEAENCGLLGMLRSEGARRVVVEESGRVVGVAIALEPQPIVMSRMPVDCVAELASIVREWKLPGARGPVEVVREFCKRWGGLNRREYRLDYRLMSHQLDRVIRPRAVAGRLMQGSREHLELLARWGNEFARAHGEPHDDPVKHAEKMLAEKRAFLWVDCEPVSMAAWAGPTPNGIRINHVYTPVEMRGRGYASACVAALSQRMLDEGRKFCFLFTDIANPISNRIYARIGYRAVAEGESWVFEEGPGTGRTH